MKDTTKKYGGAAALVAGGLLAGGLMTGTFTANAATAPTPSTATGTAPTNPNPGNPSLPQRSDESLLTGDTAAKVKAAALGKYPGATVVRLETDSDGVYEAHLTKADGTPVTVEVNKSFVVTGDEAGGPGGHP